MNSDIGRGGDTLESQGEQRRLSTNLQREGRGGEGRGGGGEGRGGGRGGEGRGVEGRGRE